MFLPKAWLEKFIEIDVPIKEFSDLITNTGNHVESIISRDQYAEGVVVGKILSVEPHPNADRLVVCQIDVGEKQVQIATGATNVFEGAYVPVALDGAHLAGDVIIKTSELRGVESQGMMCSLEELGFDLSVIPKESRDGIHILPEAHEPGTPIREVLELDQEVIEFEITPNRPDCLSVAGMAIEAAAALDRPVVLPEIHVTENSDTAMEDVVAGIALESPHARRFYSRLLTDVVIEPSPQWLQNDLMGAGIRPINNIVDLTNYAMLEYGQPLHAYDLSTLAEERILVREAREGETLTTLDGVERKLTTDDLLICDGAGPIGLAGVMGGLDSEITSNTRTVLLEGAAFDDGHIRKTSKRLGLRTEASSRFERGLSADIPQKAVDRVCELAVAIGAAKVAKGAMDVYPKVEEPWTVDATVSQINGLLGTEIAPEAMERYLTLLHVAVERNGDELHCTIPTFRRDLTIWQDLAEEVGRVYGFQNIEPQPLSGELTRGGKPKYRKVEQRAKEILLGAGFDEFMTYSFMGPGAFDRLGIPKDHPLRDAVTLINPLGEEYSVMRTTLLPNLFDILVKNINVKNPSAYGFEFGNVFSKETDDEGLPREYKKLAVGYYGPEDFYYLKDLLEKTLKVLGIEGLSYRAHDSLPFFHKYRAADVSYNGEHLGYFGELHPALLEKYGFKERAYLCELDFTAIVNHYDSSITYSPIPRFPGMERDLALVVDLKVPAAEIESVIRSRGDELLAEAKVVDVYSGTGVAEGKKSVTVSLLFRSPVRTLKDEEIQPLVQGILEDAEKQLGATLR
ncbi:MAG: phenylalanine--tRNA ligase subunit beta [Tissierellia bacterium]|nr:phenylalanine--tRNA ligase subunit beta [Tissierellia bacterium]